MLVAAERAGTKNPRPFCFFAFQPPLRPPPENFTRQFQLGKLEEKAVSWGYAREPGNNMFSVVNAYTRGAKFRGLSAESGYRLQKVGGNILAMLK